MYKIYENLLPKKQIKKINSIIVKNHFTKGNNSDGASDEKGVPLRNMEVFHTYWHHVKPYLNNIYQIVLNDINNLFGFQTFEMNDYRHINLNIYTSNSKYDYHRDHSQDYEKIDLKGTILINCSEESYKGGDFYCWFNGENILIPEFNIPGNIIYLKPWVFHKVSPVLQGKRKTIAIFITGPKWI